MSSPGEMLFTSCGIRTWSGRAAINVALQLLFGIILAVLNCLPVAIVPGYLPRGRDRKHPPGAGSE